MSLSLSKADQYHISIKADFPPKTKYARVKVHFFLPNPLAQNSDITNSNGFYQNLLHKQVLQSTTPPCIETIGRELIILRQTAFAKAAHNIARYKKALSHFVTGIRVLHTNKSFDELLIVYELIDKFQIIHDSETSLTNSRLYQLANHQVTYYFYQSLLQIAREQNAKVTSHLKQLIDIVFQYAQIKKIPLHYDTEEGRERLHNKLHLGRKVINNPYKVKTKKLKSGEFAEQVIFGFSAAFAMAFATSVAFITQRAFGNFSTPFFVSLVLSYIFKDRIKELGRNYLMEKFSLWYFQHHYRFFQGQKLNEIVNAKETFYRQKRSKLPQNIQAMIKHLLNTDSINNKEDVVYQRSYTFSKEKQASLDEKFLDELTLNLSKTLRSLPKIVSNHCYQDGNNIRIEKVHKTHTIPLLVCINLDGNTEFFQYRVVTSRKGIHSVNCISIKI